MSHVVERIQRHATIKDEKLYNINMVKRSVLVSIVAPCGQFCFETRPDDDVTRHDSVPCVSGRSRESPLLNYPLIVGQQTCVTRSSALNAKRSHVDFLCYLCDRSHVI